MGSGMDRRNAYLTRLVRPQSLRHFWEWILAHPYGVLLPLFAITIFLGMRLPQLTIRTDIPDFFIEALPETQTYHQFKQTFDREEIIRLAVTAAERGKDIFMSEIFVKLSALSEDLAAIKGVKQVLSLPEIKKKVDVANSWSPQKFKAILNPVAIFKGNLYSANGTTTTLTLILAESARPRDILKALAPVILKHGDAFHIHTVGLPLISHALTDYTRRDFVRLLPIAFMAMTIFLFVIFRHLGLMLLTLLCIVTALIWTFGLMAVWQIHLSVLTLIVAVFLIALGTAYGLHISSEYVTCTQTMPEPRDAVLRAYQSVSFPTFLALTTTLIGLGSLLRHPITLINEFALFSSLGILCLFILLHTLFPALLVIFPRQKKSTSGVLASSPRIFERLRIPNEKQLQSLTKINLRYQRRTLPVIGALIGFFILGFFKLTVETDPMSYFKEDSTIRRSFTRVHQDLSGSFPVHVLLNAKKEDFFLLPENIAQISQLQRHLSTLAGVDATISYADHLKLINYGVNAFDPAYYRLPEEAYEVSMLLNNYKIILGEDLLHKFMTPNYAKANILLLTRLTRSKACLELRDQIQAYAKRHFPAFEVTVTGFNMALSASSHYLISEQIKSVAITWMLVLLIMFFLFLSAKVALTALLVNGFPILIMLGLMGWTGIAISMTTSMIACIATGLVISQMLHYLVGYHREFKKAFNKHDALYDTLAQVGRPILITILTMGIGFWILTFSYFNPTAEFGELMIVVMAAALIGNFILLPSLILHLELVTAWDLLRLVPTLNSISEDVAHELNQPLNAIKMGSEFILMMTHKEASHPIERHQLEQIAREISNQVDRSSEMINKLRRLEIVPDLTPHEETDINQCVHDTLALVRPRLTLENIDLRLNLHPDLPPIGVQPNRLTQMIFNLLNNAREAFRAHTVERIIQIRTYSDHAYVYLEIADTGSGIADSILDRIFDPFFSTKKTDKTKGLGLSITKEIVRNLHGAIDVVSKEKKGTAVTLRFPLP